MNDTESAWDARILGDNSFDVLRLILASLVVLEHSFYLIDNAATRDPLFIASGGQLHFGSFAVYMFFVLSGFLVMRSLLESSSVVWYLARRTARIVPGFLVATAVGVLIVGPFTTPSVANYFHAQNWVSLTAAALTLKQVAVSGAFPENPLPLVHGTLWTIKYELDCYLLLAALGALSLFRPALATATFAVIAALLAAGHAFTTKIPDVMHGIPALLISSPARWPELFSFFFVGAALYCFRSAVPKSPAIASAAALTVLASLQFGGAYWALLLAGSYAILFAALSFSGEVRLFGRRVDISYGIYLYSWPVQQLLLHEFGLGISPLALFTLSLALSIIVACVSWYIVEKPALRFVRSLQHRRSPIALARAA